MSADVSQRWRVRTVPAALGDRYRAAGWWRDETLGDAVDRSLRAAPDAGLHVWSRTRPWHGTYADVHDEARRLVTVLRDAGVAPGSAVAFNLRNWRVAGLFPNTRWVHPKKGLYLRSDLWRVLAAPPYNNRGHSHAAACPTCGCTSWSVTSPARRPQAWRASVGTWSIVPPRPTRSHPATRTRSASSPTHQARRATPRA